MLNDYLKFLKGVSVSKTGKAGVVLTTSSFVTFLILEFARMIGVFTNTYLGLITYLLFPTLFLIGLILIPIAWQQRKKESGKSGRELLDLQFSKEETAGSFLGSKVFLSIATLSILNILFLVLASSQMLGFMDEAEFCGTACHSTMNPEWTTYQQSPHAHVKCVECHVGEGVDALIASKLNGMYQMISITFNLYERPIPTPVHQLRPARETCEKCHWPNKFYGSKLKTIVHYDMDEASTPRYTTLNLKIDETRGQKTGIHWHIAPENEVRYASVDDKRLEMIWVEARQKDGSVVRYMNRKILNQEKESAENERTMDCVDCHNRATHIYEDPSAAIDARMQKGQMDRSLPYIKREGLTAITQSFTNKEAGMDGVRKYIEGFYRRNYPKIAETKMDKIDQAAETFQSIYHRNIHPSMNIQWGSYPNFLGHGQNSGCFRCHNENMVNEKGKAISYECTTCHSILAQDETEPFKYLMPANKKDPTYDMHRYLQDEFLHSFKN